MTPFIIRDYGKRELGRLYFKKTKTEKGALNNLKFWIRGNKELMVWHYMPSACRSGHSTIPPRK